MTEKIVGHKTILNDDGTHRHDPLTRGEADEILKQVEIERKRREELIPDENAAVKLMSDCQQRLRDLGWKEAPRFTTRTDPIKCKAIEFGSTGIFDVYTTVSQKDDRIMWWTDDRGDTWPIRPTMIKED